MCEVKSCCSVVSQFYSDYRHLSGAFSAFSNIDLWWYSLILLVMGVWFRRLSEAPDGVLDCFFRFIMCCYMCVVIFFLFFFSLCFFFHILSYGYSIFIIVFVCSFTRLFSFDVYVFDPYCGGTECATFYDCLSFYLYCVVDDFFLI